MNTVYLRCLRYLGLAVSLSVAMARPAHALFDAPPSDCITSSNFIVNPTGGEVRVTPETPLGAGVSPPTFVRSVVAAFCDYDVGDEEAAAALDGTPLALVMEASSLYPQVESPYGVMIGLPRITDAIGVALQVVSGNGQPVVAGQKEWVIGTDGEIGYFFEEGRVRMQTPRTQSLVYRMTKIAQTSMPGRRLIGGYPNIFTVKWVIGYGTPEAKVLGRTVVDMNIGSVLAVTAQGCRYENVIQTLARVRRAEFHGVGTTLAETPIEVPITCYGAPSVNFSITPRHPYDAVPGMGLADDGRGKGVGVQLLKDSSGDVPWDFSSIRPLDEAKETRNVVRIPIPLRARYYQIERDVNPGRLQVVYTFTLTYD
ncbi:fimbrial protein [Bordetella hinzii]|nr:hypothetical protein [Bordetella hinzii]AKQ55510.1 Fimbria adhesin protein precursor [Bordetella hinzii]AKQ60012.1 Fimbria adhesin protein precursor [Bordetella hinzii]KCB30123.1 fimbrial protein [Bordetella hinzii L60]KCB42991.1 fimbrial protein [Bordetella hinzii 4161]KCB52285.1 fimbrial protein [Bordetella hinzii 1277]